MADLREVMVKAVDLLGRPPWGPLYQDLIGEAQHDPEVAAALDQRFIQPQTADTLARLKTARERGRSRPTSTWTWRWTSCPARCTTGS